MKFSLPLMQEAFKDFPAPKNNQLHYKYDFNNVEHILKFLPTAINDMDSDSFMVPFILKGYRWDEVKKDFLLSLCCTINNTSTLFWYCHDYAKAYFGLSLIRDYFDFNDWSFDKIVVNQITSYCNKELVEGEIFLYLIYEGIEYVYLREDTKNLIHYYSESQKQFLAKHLRFMLNENMVYEKDDCIELNQIFDEIWKPYLID